MNQMIKSIKVRLNPNNKQLTKLFHMQAVIDLLIIGLFQENRIIISKGTNFYQIVNCEKNLHN